MGRFDRNLCSFIRHGDLTMFGPERPNAPAWAEHVQSNRSRRYQLKIEVAR